MAFADPQSVTINAVAQSLPRVGSGPNSGSFRKDDATVKLAISHNYGKRVHRTIRLDHEKYAADPLIAAENVLRAMSVTLSVNTPVTGYTVTEAKQIVEALVDYLTDAKIIQLLGGEN